MAENVLALLLHLTAEGSPLPELAGGYTRPHTVFYEYFGFFLAYSFTTAKILYSTFLVIAFVVARATYVDPTPALKNGTSFFGEQLKGFVAVSASFIGAVVGANVVALLMDKALGKSFSWFSSEFACVVLYGPAALTGQHKCLLQYSSVLIVTH